MRNGLSRRGFVGFLGASLAWPLLLKRGARDEAVCPPGRSPAGRTSVPVQAPGIPSLPFSIVNGVKVFELSAAPVTVEFPDMSDGMGMKGRPINVWGYNGSMIGPTLEAVEGDRVRVLFRNDLPEPTTVHFHGIELPIGMDGVPLFSQKPVPPGGTFVYEFDLRQSGTYFYHSHYMTAKQIGLGLMGFFIIHPRNPTPSQIVDQDYAYFLHAWKINPGSPIPDTLEMTEFNYFTMNGRVGAGAMGWRLPPMKARVGERVRIRVTNLSMLAHPVHLHGHTFRITEWGGGFLPEHQQIRANTISVSAGEVRTLEFVARAPGKWMFHCHFTHHTMNDMHRPPLPGDPPMSEGMMAMMDMGGMATWIEITG